MEKRELMLKIPDDTREKIGTLVESSAFLVRRRTTFHKGFDPCSGYVLD
jgi:hypothetical protein